MTLTQLCLDVMYVLLVMECLVIFDVIPIRITIIVAPPNTLSDKQRLCRNAHIHSECNVLVNRQS